MNVVGGCDDGDGSRGKDGGEGGCRPAISKFFELFGSDFGLIFSPQNVLSVAA